jgi:hypothetical protein
MYNWMSSSVGSSTEMPFVAMVKRLQMVSVATTPAIIRATTLK